METLILTDTFSTVHDCFLCRQTTFTYRDALTGVHYCLPCLETAVDQAEMERHAATLNKADARWLKLLTAVAEENWRLLNGAVGAAVDNLPETVFMDALYPGDQMPASILPTAQVLPTAS